MASMRALEAAQDHHGDMNQKKENEKVCQEEVQRARGLVAAKDGDHLRDYGGDGGRHGEPGDDDQGKEEKDDGKI